MFNYNQQGQQPFGQQQFSQQQFGQQSFGQQQQFFQPQLSPQQIRQQNQQLHDSNVKEVLKKIYQIQNQPELVYLIQTLNLQLKMSNDFINKAMNDSDLKSTDLSKKQAIQARLERIKLNNNKLLQKLLKAKAKLQKLMYHSMNQHSKYEVQNAQVMDKIRTLKSQISQKCSLLKTLRVNRPQEQSMMKRKEPVNYVLKGNLEQIGASTQILEKTVLRDKAQMELLVKYLRQKN